MSDEPRLAVQQGPAKYAEDAMQTVQRALPLVLANLPYLSPLAYAADYRADDRIAVAAVTESGRVLVNSEVFRDLPLPDAAYVLAHELLHLALATFGRGGGADAETENYAHDYVINDLLTESLGMKPPLGGLHWSGASQHSFEQVVQWMRSNSSPHAIKRPTSSWSRSLVPHDHPAGLGPLGRALQEAGVTREPGSLDLQSQSDIDRRLARGDMIPLALEQVLFGESRPHIQRRITAIRSTAARCSALQTIEKRLADMHSATRGHQAGAWGRDVAALQGYYNTPWELALQRWADAVAPDNRSYSRPSRRGAGGPDCVRAGRIRCGWTLHIVLDTSGSMMGEWPQMLGAIVGFCQNAGVDQIHLLQCDTDVSVDEFIDIDVLSGYRIQGCGGSDMSPAMDRLAEDPAVTACVVLTDGYIAYPSTPPRYRVLWVLPERHSFSPPYGEVLFLQ